MLILEQSCQLLSTDREELISLSDVIYTLLTKQPDHRRITIEIKMKVEEV